jgi:hypothetical protein
MRTTRTPARAATGHVLTTGAMMIGSSPTRLDDRLQAEVGAVGDERGADRPRVLLDGCAQFLAAAGHREPDAVVSQVGGGDVFAVGERAVGADERGDRVGHDELGGHLG